MADNRNHDRDFLKHVEIIKPPFAELANVDQNAGCNSFPAWVGEACVGLIFDPALISPDEKSIQILPDDWILALMNQEPQELSNMAALWMNDNVFWAGGISTPIENVKILGKGRLINRELKQECYLPTIRMKIHCTGVSLGGFGGDGIHGTDQYEIIEIIGRRLPPIKQRHLPLPLDAYLTQTGCSELRVIHEVRSHIDESDVREFKKLGVEIIYC